MRKILLLGLGIALLGLASCRYQKDLVYFEDLREAKIINRTTEDEKTYRIRVNDILYIRIISENETITRLFLATQGSGSAMGSSYMYFGEETQYYTGYSVRADGTVDLPLLGAVRVEGRSVEEARQEIQEKAGESLYDATILVKLANFRVTLLGELRIPGTYTYFNNQTTILEAIAKAGDLTDYGNRREVLIIRPTIDGSETYRVNLQNPDLLTSPNYFIQPNDVIYVPPLRAKGVRLATQDLGLFVTTISSVLSTTSLILTLIFTLRKT